MINPYENKKNLPFIIAEIGINHNGSVEIAKKLIDMAKICGADAVKFQKRTIGLVYRKEFLASPRQSPWGTTQREQKEGLELDKDEYDEIDKYCKDKGIYWFASAWDKKSQEFLRLYNLPYNKVASPMLSGWNLLNMIAEEKKHTFISCGMSDWLIIDKAVEIFKKHKCPFTLMHCVSIYPSEDEDCNISVIKVMQQRYNCQVGYSGHEKGVLPSILAVVFGATALERHITLDRTMYGSDQSASLEKRGLELLVRDARKVTRIIGDGCKHIKDRETSKLAKYIQWSKDSDVIKTDLGL